MPDATGALTPADNDTIQRWWNQHWKAPVTCPVCKTTEWTIAPHVVNFQRHAMDASVGNTVSYPHIVVTCKNCAHSMFFNAVQVGVSPSRPVPMPSYMGGLLGAIAPQSPFGSLAQPPEGGALSSLMKKDK
jgi:predicted nucleic-acid-binding Zn-ribbon protein